MEQIYTPKQDYKVLVRCFTYNQSKYIEDALSGFAMQQTDFPFVCLVMDDCSTDGEQEFIKTWMERECDMEKAEYIDLELSNVILVPHKSNLSCDFAFYFLKQNLYGTGEKKMKHVTPWREHCEYEAMCEGDDYWIHFGKLQMQVSFLDSHLDYGLVHTDFNLTKGKRNHQTVIYPDGKAFPDVLTKGIHVGTATALYRLKTYAVIPKYFLGKGWPMGDYPLWIEIAYISKIHYIPEVTACYRILEQSASHSQDFQKLLNFYNSFCEIRKFYIEKFNVDEYVDIHSSTYYETIVRYACRLGCKDEARKYYHEAKIHGKLTRKCTLFYWATLIPILKYLIELYIKI